MPQPYRGHGYISMHPEALLTRPWIGALVAESIAAFARVELAIAVLFTRALRTEEEVALDIYLALQAEGPKSATIDQILRRRLPEDMYKRLTDIKRHISSLSGWRNSFAHGVWATANDLGPHEIILVDFEEAIRWRWRK